MKAFSRQAALTYTVLAIALVQTTSIFAQSSTNGLVKYGKSVGRSKVGLDGYCPVCIIAARKWEKGGSKIDSTFDGVTYCFPNAALKQKLEKSPQDFVPALNGDCIVCYKMHGKRVPGKIEHAAINKGRLFLFPSEKEKAVFLKDPNSYMDSDVAENGDCIVCKVAAGKKVPGSTKHTVVHNGLRYLFPSEREASVFRKNPGKFTSSKTSFSGNATESGLQVSVSGRSACAACEFGVSPLGAAAELGLAIVGADKKVTVVEDAHKLYPGIYKNRFKGQRLVANGQVVKRQGSVTWIRPTSLKIDN